MPKKSELTPIERSMQGRLAAHESWAYTPDRLARTAAARNAAEHRFEKLVDPDGILPPEERAKRAENAKQAHMTRMALAAAKARRLRKHAAAIDAELGDEDPELRAGAEQAVREAGGVAK
jgi:hypothetical protein